MNYHDMVQNKTWHRHLVFLPPLSRPSLCNQGMTRPATSPLETDLFPCVPSTRSVIIFKTTGTSNGPSARSNPSFIAVVYASITIWYNCSRSSCFGSRVSRKVTSLSSSSAASTRLDERYSAAVAFCAQEPGTRKWSSVG